MRKVKWAFFLVGLFFIQATKAETVESLIESNSLEAKLTGKKIGIYLGSFDPIHYGHESVALKVLAENLCDYLIIYPAWGNNPTKKRIPVQLRLKMIEPIFANHPRILTTKLSPYALQDTLTVIKNGKNQQTSNARQFQHVSPRFKNSEFIAIVGSDLANKIDRKYKENKKISNSPSNTIATFMGGMKIPYALNNSAFGDTAICPATSFIVAMRAGESIKGLNGYIDERPIAGVIYNEKTNKLSSTHLKKMLKSNNSISHITTPSVSDFIREKHLYQ